MSDWQFGLSPEHMVQAGHLTPEAAVDYGNLLRHDFTVVLTGVEWAMILDLLTSQADLALMPHSTSDELRALHDKIDEQREPQMPISRESPLYEQVKALSLGLDDQSLMDFLGEADDTV